MQRPVSDWDPSWDDDWQAAQPDLEEQIREDHPPDPAKAVEYYRYGFVAAKRNAAYGRPENLSELYEDFMTGVGEPIAEEGYEETQGWLRRGWDAGRDHLPPVQRGDRSMRVTE